MRKEFDVGIVGYWYATNYGSVLTYYALTKAIESFGLSTLLIDCPEKEKDPEGEDVISRRFLNKYCNISESVSWNDYDKLNLLCKNFVIGSDQVWTPDAIRLMKYMFFLSFADDTKRKIAYAPSFGTNKFEVSQEVSNRVKELLYRFNAISVREDVGKQLLEDRFGIEAEQTLDPVFLLDKKEYHNIAEESCINVQDKYILAYILDPTPDKEIAILKLKNELNMKVKIVLDARKGTFKNNLQKLTILDKNDVLEDVEVQDWVKLFENTSYLITDSHHGLAMGIVFKKPLICYANHGRGYVRFTSLLGLLKMQERMVQKAEDITEKLIKQKIEYGQVMEVLNEKIQYSKDWLNEALQGERKSVKRQEVTVEEKKRIWDPDVERCRMVVSMLKQYGIKHVVLSSGTRNLNLCRFFEASPWFQTYNVIDERSAGFYAIGLSLELNSAVALCCTSGTAASNYLTAVTEAFYQQVPLVVITADRYPCFLGQMEDQTIPQTNMFNGVIKKSVSLPVGSGDLVDWETRRMIAEAILEAKHHGKGPVHINVPIQGIHRLPPPKKELFLWNYRMIKRIEYKDNEELWKAYVTKLSEVNRVLLIYGQNKPLNEDDKKCLEEFVEKYNCVVITDHLSNLKNKDSILSYPILKNMSQQEFDEILSPDIVITVGGKRMLNDPITFKLRGMSKNCEHWRVAEDGKIADTFRRLSVVFECEQQYFFKYFSDNVKKICNNKEYLNTWKVLEKKYENINYSNEYSMKYTIEKFIKAIPDNSLLHIGIGNTVMFTNIYPLKENVEVYCNMGTNGIDGCASTYMGHVAVTDKQAFLVIGDLSFFYDMNSVFNKSLKPNIRIFMSNNQGAGLLRDLQSKAITHEHHMIARDYVKSLGFRYLSATNKEEYEEALNIFLSNEVKEPIFFEVFT